MKGAPSCCACCGAPLLGSLAAIVAMMLDGADADGLSVNALARMLNRYPRSVRRVIDDQLGDYVRIVRTYRHERFYALSRAGRELLEALDRQRRGSEEAA